MAVVTLDSVPKKTRDLFQKAASAMERDNFDYAIDMFLDILELEPKLLEARKLVRAAELKKLGSKKGSQLTHAVANLTGMGGIMAVNANLHKKPHKAVISAEHLLRKDPLNKSFLLLHAKIFICSRYCIVSICLHG